MTPEKTIEEQINEAIEDVRACLLENVLASRVEKEVQERKRKAHYAITKASERLNSLRSELMK